LIAGLHEVKSNRQVIMESREPLSLAEQFAAACDWWREAGIDQDFHDAPETLLKAPESTSEAPKPTQQAPRPAEEPAPPPISQIGGDPAQWPQALDEFHGWWMREESLDLAGTLQRIPPRGVPQADLMVLVPMPEHGDSEHLLSGEQGTLVRNMLRAMEIAEGNSYLASVLPRHTPLADWDSILANGMGKVLFHHIALAAPKRLLVLGRDILPLLGIEKRQGVAKLSLGETSIQLLASFAPENLLQNAKLRADLWRRWLDWTG
jgi:DNA polymerase